MHIDTSLNLALYIYICCVCRITNGYSMKWPHVINAFLSTCFDSIVISTYEYIN